MNIITISRQYGSGGREIGEKLANKLQVPFFDKELIIMAAKKSGMSEEVFKSVDERAASSFLYSLWMNGYSYGIPTATNHLPLNDQLFILQTELIKNAAEKGPCVIVGRCADYILRERHDVLHVFLYADESFRAKRAIQKYGEDEKKIHEILIKKDKQRSNYYNFYSDTRWNDPQNYHLCLNTGALGIDNSLEMILKAYKIIQP